MHPRHHIGSCALALAVIAACSGSADPSVERIPAEPSQPPSARPRIVVPTDEREVRQAEAPPPAISGGTLLASADGALAFASDPDRDRLSIVDLATQRLRATVALALGDEPGRLTEDDVGRVHVALRRGNAVATIDPATGGVIARHLACVAPRGIAFEPTARVLHVACAGGELVTLAVDGGEIVRRVALGVDLRDVIVQGDHLFVTRFKSADLIRLDAQGEMLSSQRAPAVPAEFGVAEGLIEVESLEPHVAWRSISDGSGGVLMVNQLSRTGEIQIAVPSSDDAVDHGDAEGAAGGSPYGGGAGTCSGVVQSALTKLDPAGLSQAVRIPGTLPVDLAVSPVDGTIAVVQAGTPDPAQPSRTVEFDGADPTGMSGLEVSGGFSPVSEVQLHEAGSLRSVDFDGASSCLQSRGMGVSGQAVAVAYTPDGTLLVQSREPATLLIAQQAGGFRRYEIRLGGDSVYDTGHEIFHRDPGGGVACASCHAEGGDDGHVWRFSTLGARRTQSVSVGLADTAPFHWQGDMHDLSTLMEEVLVERMGGVHQSAPRAAALENWLFALQPPPAPRAAEDPAALRGRALFEGEAQCGSCHSGAKLTDNKTVDVGTGEPLQVPSLVGIAYRAPFIHDGCAQTLRDRFDPECGGAQHGQTAELTAEQIDDLVAYLESL